VSPVADAASVLLSRGAGSAEVFVVRRSERLKFFGGFYVFPGGRADAADADVPTDGTESNSQVTIRRAAAARELFEEAGVLVARRLDGSFPTASESLNRSRRELIAGTLLFATLLNSLGLSIWKEDFPLVGDLTTPPFTSIRFDTSFFVAELPPGQKAAVWPGELDHGHWTTAAALLSRWMRGECLVAPPTLLLLESIRDRQVAEAPARFPEQVLARHTGEVPLIDFAPAVQMLPLRTVALPPATHTNAFLVGHSPGYILDPGPSGHAEQEQLFKVLDDRLAQGKRLSAIILSHHHPDHVGAANVCAQRYALPIWAHPLTARALAGKIDVQRELNDGARIDLGTAPDASGPWHLDAIHTPGHAAGHLAFFEPHYRLLFAGDMVSTLTSIIIAPPEGDLGVYLKSLVRLRQFAIRLLLPSHGSPSARPDQLLAESLAHRARREEQLLAALRTTPRPVDELASELYKGLPGELMRFARLQILAGLEKLEREGKVTPVGESEIRAWRLRALE
jgi:glyoxylase-like metal-dependent hydrolase (beta-lactamase superfamily II)/8-oxo-dGTP pyrophosphatase MutT (NUDIX family)